MSDIDFGDTSFSSSDEEFDFGTTSTVDEEFDFGNSSFDESEGFDFGSNPTSLPPTVPNLLGAGKDMSDAMMWEGLNVATGMFGFDEEARAFKVKSDVQQELASRVQPEGFGDQVIMAAGQVAPTVAATVAGAIAAPFVGVSAGAGATVAGTLAGLGLTQGELQMKAEELDENHKADLKQVAIGTALAVGDQFVIGKARKILEPLYKAGGDKIAKNTMQAIMGTVADVGKTAVGTGAIEAVQDAGSSLAANYLTDTPIDQKRIDSVVQGSIDEFLIGAVLGVPVGGVNVAAQQLKLMQDEGIQGDLEKPRAKLELNEETGEKEWTLQVPVEGAAKQPSMFSMAVAPVFGNLTAGVRGKLWDNKAVKPLTSYFNQDKGERGSKHNTIHTNATLTKGELIDLTSDFFSASKQDMEEAFKVKASGDMDAINANPLAKNLYDNLNGEILNKLEKLGMPITEEMKRPDYLPLVAAVDWESIAKDRPTFFSRLREQGRKQGMDEQAVKALQKKANILIDSFELEGTIHSYGNKTGLNKSRKRIEKLFSDPDSTPKQRKKALKGMTEKHRTKDQKDSPLNLERGLQELDQSFWENNYIRKGMKPDTRMRLHYKLISEHMAHMEAFGVNNEKFDKLVADIIIADADSESNVSIKEIDNLYDILSTSQRIILKPINPTLRKIQTKVRAFENITLLGLSVIPSIAETLMVPLNFGGKNTMTGLGKALGVAASRMVSKAGINMSKTDADQLLTDLHISGKEAINTTANRIGEDSIDLSSAEQWVIQASGIPLFTVFTQAWAAFAAEGHLKDVSKKLASGKLSPNQEAAALRKIREAGLEPYQFMEWVDNGSNREADYYKEVKASLVELVNDTIIDPDPADKGVWFNDERFKLITQLKSFAVVFTNRVMLDWYKVMQRDAAAGRFFDTSAHGIRVATFLSSYLVMQMGLSAFREFIKSGDTERWEEKATHEHLVDAIAYLGSIGFAADPLRAPDYGADPIISLLGPAAGDASRVFKALNIASTNPEKGLEMVVKRLVPNMPAKEPITEGLVELLEDAFR